MYYSEMDSGSVISAGEWAKGIALSIVASLIGGLSKLAIRKSWLLQANNVVVRGIDQDEGSANNDLLAGEHGTTITDSDNVVVAAPSDNSMSFAPENADRIQEELPLLRQNCASRCFNCCRGDSSPVSSSSSGCSRHVFWYPYCIRYCAMFGMSVLNPICCVFAMNYASPSILAPFSGLTLCWVIIGSPFVNNEQPSTQQMLACGLIIVGEVIVAIFGDHTNDEGITVEHVVCRLCGMLWLKMSFLDNYLQLPHYLMPIGVLSTGDLEKVLYQTSIPPLLSGADVIPGSAC
jgi:hypothetical protein